MVIRKRYIMGQFEDVDVKQKQSGTVTSANSAVKIIFVLDRITMELLSSCVADKVTGYWEISVPLRSNGQLLSICRDEGGDFNADIFDRVSLCTTTFSPSTFHDNLIMT